MVAARITSILAAACACALLACGGGEPCQGDGENCSTAYREANGIDYGCCEGLSCSQNSLGDLVCR